MLEKSFQPQRDEPQLYDAWEKSGAFKCGDPARLAEGASSFSIVIPPPNVTGSLHMGHALNHTLQDILVRFERMRGKDVLWQPGTDHAGIATQMVVERQLEAEKTNASRHELGREAFIKRVWKWKAESGGTISRQLRRLGASCDWSRERFTMDTGLSRAVLKAFVELYRNGLIYKDKRLVNWDPKLLTAISDLEVVPKEMQGSLWHLRYPVEGGEGESITVATTRPETLFGDCAVAVNGRDERYQHLIGRHVILPLTGRRIPVIADDHADPEQGSGAVKITPAHDFNDFEVGRRHNLEMRNIFNEKACLNEHVPEAFQGMERFAARKAVLEALEISGLLEKTEDHLLQVPHGDRSNVVIEPWLTEQWYVDARTLAKPAIEAVEKEKTRFVPKNWEKTYFEWMRNIQPWCISRQLWWGHQIPAWYGPDRKIFVAYDEEEAQALAEAHYGESVPLHRDPDVLDTWFSSALWPFSTMGWPEKTPELERYYRTSTLVTGFDIIFFWVARMMMFGLHFMKEIPFDTVYVHALVRDDKGQKMSKSRGNVINPLELIDTYGADALRFTLSSMAAQGRDVRLSTQRVEGYRNFGTKLWNAARFCQLNGCVRNPDFVPSSLTQTLNAWIVGEVRSTATQLTHSLESYRFNDASHIIYRFVWNVFCDWYLEFAKLPLNENTEAARAETQAVAAWVLDQILIMLHPFMPFLTEKLWQQTHEVGQDKEGMLILAPWPACGEEEESSARTEMDWVIALISEVRSLRSEVNVPAGAKIPMLLSEAASENRKRLEKHRPAISRMAGLSSVEFLEGNAPAHCLQTVLGEATILLPLSGVLDLEAERKRMGQALKKIDNEIARIEGKLSNRKFLENAPDAVIAEQKQRHTDARNRREKTEKARARLESLEETAAS